MKHKLFGLILSAGMAVVTLNVQAQQTPSQSLTDLRKQIEGLLLIERDPSTPEEVRRPNDRFIQERRAQLRALLKARIEALQKYQVAVQSIIRSDEKAQVVEIVRDLEKELSDVEATIALKVSPPRPDQPSPTDAPNSSIAITDAGNGAALTTGTSGSSTPPRAEDPVQLLPLRDPQRSSGGKAEEALRDQFEVERGNIVDEVVRTVRGKSGDERVRAADIFSPLRSPTSYAKVLALGLSMAALPRSEFTNEIESARVDKQVGGSASNAGSTSLVSKGSIPAILGFAVENGGLAQTTNGTTITFRGNPVGLFDALTGKGFIDSFEDDSQTIRRLRKLSFALSYDTSLGDNPNQFIGNRQQLSSYSFRYEFFNHRDPRDPRYADEWTRLIRTNAQAVATRTNIVQNLFFRDTSLRDWLATARQAIAAATDAELESVVKEQLQALEKVDLSPAVEEAVTNFSTAFSDYRNKKDVLLNLVDNGPIFSVEYTNKRRPGLIDTSNINFIYSTGIAEGKASLTFNGAATLFNARPPASMKRFRDFDFATQLDLPLGDPRGFGQFDLSFAGRYRRLVDDEIVDGILLNTKGDIGTFNLKLDIPIRDLGMRFPVSFTYSNRTEFDLKRQLRANFGFAFDPDFLYNLLKPFTKR